jgi:hypothetical protein
MNKASIPDSQNEVNYAQFDSNPLLNPSCYRLTGKALA